VSIGRPPPWVVGLTGFAIVVLMVVRVLAFTDLNVTVFLAFGKEGRAQVAGAERFLDGVQPRSGGGHDGKYFFALANDPWLLQPRELAEGLDRPAYRAQRILYPMIAGGFGLFAPEVVVWAMLLLNLASMGVGSYLTACLAVRTGANPWLGLSFALNIGLVAEMIVGGAGVLAYVLCIGALLASSRRDERWTPPLFAAAALTREVMLLFPLGVFVLTWRRERQARWAIVGWPMAAIAVWAGYVQWRVGGMSGAHPGPKIFSPPFVGLVEAVGHWVRDPAGAVLTVAILIVMVAFAIRGARSRLPIVWGALPFVAATTVLSVHVWREYYDLARAIAPVFTAAVFLLVIERDRDGPSGTVEARRNDTGAHPPTTLQRDAV
jgi:hypothetical protein